MQIARKVELDQPVPDFQAQATSNKDVLLSACRGYSVVLFFYPKDATPGCTQEGQDFKELYDTFKEQKCCIFGISRDSLSSHEKFKANQGFPFELISDTDQNLCNIFGVIKEKNMYGKQVMGIERSTFLIDPEGVLIREWRGVKVPGHAQEVLDSVRELTTEPA